MKVFVRLVTFSAFLWVSCHAQVYDDGLGDIIMMLQKTMDLLFDQADKISNLETQNQNLSAQLSVQSLRMTSLEEHLKASSASQEEQIRMLSHSQEDECHDATHGCSKNAQCIDRVFSYKCHCLDGYSGDGFQCDDIDECTEETICSPNASCTNTPGSYSCTCNDGFYKGEGDKCEDIDECTEETICSPNASCTNKPGSYSCTCNDGFYKGEGDKCEDIDECTEETICSPNASCTNTPGSYSCTCNDAFYKGEGDKCEVTSCDSPFKFVHGVGCIHIIEQSQKFDSGRDSCKKLGGDLFVATEKEHYLKLAQHFIDTNQKAIKKYMWVGVKEGVWLNGRRVAPEEEAPGNPSMSSGKCSYTDGDTKEKFLLWTDSCTDSWWTLCGQNIVTSCDSPFKFVHGVGCIHIIEQSQKFDSGRDSCKKLGGDLFVATEKEHYLKLAQHFIDTNQKAVKKYMWVGVKEGVWLNGRRVAPEEEAPGNPSMSSGKCSYTDGDTKEKFLLWTDPCTDSWWTLCGKDIDIDECTEETICGPNASCTNTSGSYSCTCNDGFYKGEGDKCEELKVSGCDSPFKFVHGVGCIHIIERKQTFDSGRDSCKKLGGDLFVATEKEHYLKLAQHFIDTNQKAVKKYMWVGVKEGVWLNGRRVAPEEEAPGNPSMSSGKCSYTDGDTKEKFLLWTDPCTESWWTLCEKNVG